MSKISPIIHTRVPAALQQVFIKANRGEVVNVPPNSFCRRWDEGRAQTVATKTKKSASFPEFVIFNADIHGYHSSSPNDKSPIQMSLFFDIADHPDVSSHGSVDDMTVYEHWETMQQKPASFCRWDAECSLEKRDTKLTPCSRLGSFRWELKTAEGKSGFPKMPTRH